MRRVLASIASPWRVLCVALATIVIAGVPRALDAQLGQGPPGVWFTPEGGTYTHDTLTIQIDWCDDISLRPNTRQIHLNGQNVTATFTYVTSPSPSCGQHATSTKKVTLALGTNVLRARICDFDFECTEEVMQFVYATRRAPDVSTAPQKGDFRSTAMCAVDCFDAVVAYSTPAYVSMDTPRGATLRYSSALAAPRGVVEVDVQDSSGLAASRILLRLMRPNGSFVDFLQGTEASASYAYFARLPGWNRLAVQFDASTLPTGAYDYTLEVTSQWSDTAITVLRPVKVLVVNERESLFGAGWTLVGLQRLHFQADGSFVITEGDGSALHYLHAAPAGDFSTLSTRASWADGVKYERRYLNGDTAAFYTDGALAYISDRYGNRTIFGYDGPTGQLRTITDPANHSIALAFGGDGKLDWIEEHGRRSTVTIDGAGDLVRIDDPLNAAAFRGTYVAHRLATQLNRRGGETSVLYDHLGKVERVLAPPAILGGQSRRLTSRVRAPLRQVLPDPGVPSEGSLASPKSPVAVASLRGAVFAPSGDSTRFSIDAWGAATRVETAQDTLRVTRDLNGLTTETISLPRGDTVQYTWVSGYLTKEWRLGAFNQSTGKRGEGADYTYEGGLLKSAAIWGGSTVTYFYTNGMLDSSSADSAVSRYSHDARGRRTSVTDALGHRSDVFFAPTGFLNTDSTRTGTRRMRFWYDGYGRTIAVTGPDNRTDSVAFDLLNRPVSSRNPLAHLTTTTYSDSGVVVTDPKGQSFGFVQNPIGLAESRRDPNGQLDRFTYDSLGYVATWTNRRGQVTSFTHDLRGRLLTRTLADGRVTTFSHAPTRTVASNQESVDTLPAPTDSMVSEITWRAGLRFTAKRQKISANFYTTINRWQGSTSVWQRGAIWNTYQGRLSGITPYDHLKTSIGYNDDGDVDSLKMPGITQLFRYRPNHALATSAWNGQGVDQAFGQGYVHDTLGQVREVRPHAGRDTLELYAHDALGQLERHRTVTRWQWACVGADPAVEIEPECPSEYVTATIADHSFSYDVAGNPLHGGAQTDWGNRLRVFAEYALEYDLDGNLTRKYKPANPTWEQRYYWNSINQLDSVTGFWSPTVRFGYDGLGRRVRKTTGSSTIRYLYLGEELVAETDAGGAVLRSYTYYPGVDQPHSLIDANNQLFHFVSDGRGNVMGLLNSSGAIVNRYRYSPSGERLFAMQGAPNSLQFAGREYDSETDLYFNRARYYDPSLQRFISEDPIGIAGGLNVYQYASNNPVMFRDPSGLCAIVGSVDGRYWGEASLGRVLPGPSGGSYTCCPGRIWMPVGVFCLSNSGEGRGSPGERPRATDPVGYTPVSSCPAFLQSGEIREGLEQMLVWQSIANVEMVSVFRSLAGGGVQLQPLPANATRSGAEVAPFLPIGSVTFNHTHPRSGPSQGPSRNDSSAVAYFGVVGLVISPDSMFWMNPNGSTFGCSR